MFVHKNVPSKTNEIYSYQWPNLTKKNNLYHRSPRSPARDLYNILNNHYINSIHL